MKYRAVSTSLLSILLLASAASAEPLKLCLDDSAPPFSSNREGKADGFDLKLADAIAGKLGRDLEVQWFHTEDQPEAGKDTKTIVSALLSDNRCELAGSYPLLSSALDNWIPEKGRLPRFKGGTPEDRRRSVALKQLAATTPFIYTALAVAFGPDVSERKVRDLDDLDGLWIGVEQSSVVDVTLMLYQNGRLLKYLRHIPAGSGLFDRLEAGEYRVVLADLHRVDGYRLVHPKTKIKQSGYLHPGGFNLGFVGLASNSPLLQQVNEIIESALRDGTVERLASEAGLTYLSPRAPAVRSAPSIAELASAGAGSEEAADRKQSFRNEKRDPNGTNQE